MKNGVCVCVTGVGSVISQPTSSIWIRHLTSLTPSQSRSSNVCRPGERLTQRQTWTCSLPGFHMTNITVRKVYKRRASVIYTTAVDMNEKSGSFCFLTAPCGEGCVWSLRSHWGIWVMGDVNVCERSSLLHVFLCWGSPLQWPVCWGNSLYHPLKVK